MVDWEELFKLVIRAFVFEPIGCNFSEIIFDMQDQFFS